MADYKYISNVRMICQSGHEVWPSDEVDNKGEDVCCPECGRILPLTINDRQIMEKET